MRIFNECREYVEEIHKMLCMLLCSFAFFLLQNDRNSFGRHLLSYSLNNCLIFRNEPKAFTLVIK